MAKDTFSDNILRNVLILLIVIGIAYLAYYLMTQSTNKENSSMQLKDTVNQGQGTPNINYSTNMVGDVKGMENPIMNKKNYNPNGPIVGQNNMEHFSVNENFEEQRQDNSFPKDQLTAEELLPQDNSSLWAQVNPSGEGTLKDRNFLQSGYHIGINTVGQTLRNANLQLRSEPPCPQVVVSPFIQSTIEPDLSRKPFEIGGCA
jgi:hypothetical protein